MNRTPLVSVIIPCFNQACYLIQAIESVLAQTYSRIEIIVVNDGSPDDIQEVMQKFQKNKNISLLNQSNQGLSTARNNGIKQANGSYLQFLDADDWLAPEKIEKQIEVLEAEVTIGLAYCDFYHFYEDTGKFFELNAHALGSLEQDPLRVLWSRCVFPPHAALLKREWFERVGKFTTDLVVLEDFDFWLRLSLIGCRMRHIAQPLVFYRQHANSMLKTTPIETINNTYSKIRASLAKEFPASTARASVLAFQNLNKLIEQEQWKIHQLDGELNSAKKQIAQKEEEYLKLEAAFREHISSSMEYTSQLLNSFREVEQYAKSLESELAKSVQTESLTSSEKF